MPREMLIRHSNPEVWKELKKKYKDTLIIDIGFPRTRMASSQKYPNSNFSVVDVAWMNEFGTEKIPSRPFLKTGTRIAYELLRKDIARAVKKTNNGKDLRKELKKIGEVARSIVQQTITEFSEPPNSPITIERKGSDNPLIDTGLMRASVNYKVRKI